MAGPAIARIGNSSRRAYAAVNVGAFRNIGPLSFLKNFCGLDILSTPEFAGRLAGRTISILAFRKLENVASIKLPGEKRVGRENAAKVIAACRLFAEGVDMEKEDFKEIVSKMSVLMLHSENTDLYQDLCTVGRFVEVIGRAIELSGERIKDLVVAGLLHDIGKAAGKDADREVEIGATKVHDRYKRFTVEEASVLLFAKRDSKWKTDKDGKFLLDESGNKIEYTIKGFIEEFFKGDKETTEGKAIIDVLESDLMDKFRINIEKDPISLFYNLHTYLGYALLEGKISDFAHRIMGLHHVTEKINPLDGSMLLATYKIGGLEDYDVVASCRRAIEEAKERGYWKEVVILIIADKLDAWIRRGTNDYNKAISILRGYIENNEVLSEEEKADFYSVIDTVKMISRSELIRLGLI
jgi:hypothetical protein